MEDFIQLKKDNIKRFGIKDAEGNDTGESIEFDLEDIETMLKLNECEAMHRKNFEDLKAQFIIIDKRQDKKGKFLLTKNEEDKIKATQVFYEKEIEAWDLFLGKGGARKLLNGRKPYLEMNDDFIEMLTPILPKLEQTKEDIVAKIKNKYKDTKENDVLE